jgi:hypothetical protein
MRKSFGLTFVLLLSVTAFSQEKPLSQAEYVKMLYALEKNPSVKAEVVVALRRRGIAFALTDGVRGLTRSKGRNDEELKRALEEAERRRVDPEASKLPSANEALGFIDKARERAQAAIDERPDFVVKQLITRLQAFAGTGNWKPYDTLVIAVSYHSEKGEQYRVLAKNGAPVPNAGTGSNYAGLDGATSGGEFTEDLAKIFKADSKTHFGLVTTDLVRGRRTLVYEYVINVENNKRGVIYRNGSLEQVSPSGEKGRIWIDRENFRVLRIENNATDITSGFPIKAVTKTIDFDVVEIANEKHLLPTISDIRFTVDVGAGRFEMRNVIRFRNYQKYGTDVIAVDDDSEPVVDEKPNQ